MSNDIFHFSAPIGSLIEVTDEDAASFLHSQFSNDLPAEEGQTGYGLWLDHRGRIHGDSTILRLGAERFFLLSWATLSETLIAKLDAHIIADDVVLADRTETFRSVVLFGPGASEWLKGHGFELPPADRFSETNGLMLLQPRPAPSGDAWQIIGSFNRIQEVTTLLSRLAPPVSPDVWHAARIQAGYPLIPSEVGPDDTPIEAGLESLCSWTKGCFLGQEIVARQHRLGRRSRSLAVVSLTGGIADCALPAVLFDEETAVGTLRAVVRKNGQHTGLAMLKSRYLESPQHNPLWIENTKVKVTIDGAVR